MQMLLSLQGLPLKPPRSLATSIPAALIAGVSVPLGFAFPFPRSSDKPVIKGLKALNIALGFISIQSELRQSSCRQMPSIVSRGSSGFAIGSSAATALDLFKSDPAASTRGRTYLHFVAGVFGVVIMCGIRGWLAVGPTFGKPLIIGTGAILARFLATVNRGIIAQEVIISDAHRHSA